MGGKSSKGKNSHRAPAASAPYAESLQHRRSAVDPKIFNKRLEVVHPESIAEDNESEDEQVYAPMEDSRSDAVSSIGTHTSQITKQSLLTPRLQHTPGTPQSQRDSGTPKSHHAPVTPLQVRIPNPISTTPGTPQTPRTPLTPNTPRSQRSTPHSPLTDRSQTASLNLTPKLKPEVIAELDHTLSTSSSISAAFKFAHLAEDDNGRTAPMYHREATTSMSGIVDNSKPTSQRTLKRVDTVDVKTSTPQMGPCFCPDTIFYHRNQHVGTETRHTEFKRGGVVFDQRAFRSLIGRYLCAFLNTEGGVIYFGVTDDGKVVGIKINQKMEDDIRLSVDSVVSLITPNVSTDSYSFNLAKVMNEDGVLENDLKVMEICVHPRSPPRSLHSFDGNKYVRRDGSLRTV